MNSRSYTVDSALSANEIASLWKSANVVDKYGISVFQRNIEIVVETNLRAAGLRLHDRNVERAEAECIAAAVPDLGLRVEIFRDHMRVKHTSDNREAFCMEWFDDLIPKDHYDAADEFFKDEIAVHKGRFHRSE